MGAFRDALQIDQKVGDKSNQNILLSTALDGAEVIFEDVTSELQSAIIGDVVTRFASLVKNVTRTSSNDASRSHSGLLACRLSMMMLRSMGKNHLQSLLFTPDVMTSMIHITQWRYDPKARVSDEQSLYWDAAVCHCLQIMSTVLGGTARSLEDYGIDPGALSRTVLMLTRPGKAPRKACDFLTALRRIIQEGQNAAAAVAAQRIVHCLEE
jgi:hypothetical protein